MPDINVELVSLRVVQMLAGIGLLVVIPAGILRTAVGMANPLTGSDATPAPSFGRSVAILLASYLATAPVIAGVILAEVGPLGWVAGVLWLIGTFFVALKFLLPAPPARAAQVAFFQGLLCSPLALFLGIAAMIVTSAWSAR